MGNDLGRHALPLRDGSSIPVIGFGTWQLEGDEAYRATLHALETGYRHIDTATGYGNEAQVGAALRDSGVDRADVFITTKCPPENAGRETETIDQSLRLLGLDHVDLWLVHWPPNGEARPETWAQFIAARDAGKTRSIGVSNYSIAQVDELVAATGEAPSVNQIRWSPSLYDPATAAALAERRVLLEGYSPLRRCNLDHPALAEVARARSKAPAQVVLRWHVDKGFVVIPKSAHNDRIEQNFDIGDFELTAEELAQLDAMAGD